MKGTDRLVETVVEAMALLKKAPDHRKAIDSLVHMVTDSDIDTPYEDVAARDVYLCERDLDGGSTWSAGQMRHGATHIWLFNEGIFLLTPMMEFVCFQQQAYCLEELAYVHHGIRIDPDAFINEYMKGKHWAERPLVINDTEPRSSNKEYDPTG